MNEEQKQAVANAKIKIGNAIPHFVEIGLSQDGLNKCLEDIEPLTPKAHESVQSGTCDSPIFGLPIACKYKFKMYKVEE